jgi:2,4-diaminopentanoate dehydrogenase
VQSRKDQPLKVIQWATGGVGKAAIEAVLRHPRLALAGCWVHGSDKHRRDVGDILGRGALGVTATSNIDDVVAIDADAVMYSPLTANEDDVKALLRSGKNVVTPIGWVCTCAPHRRASRPTWICP